MPRAGAGSIALLQQTLTVFACARIGHLAHFHRFALVHGFGYAGVMTIVLLTARVLAPASGRATMMGVILAFA